MAAQISPWRIYIEQIQKLKSLVGGPLSIHLFTDDPIPPKSQSAIAKDWAILRLAFTFRQTDNKYYRNVIEDYYAMAKCSYLIRSDSSMSQSSQLLGNHKIVIYPIEGKWVKEKLIINSVGVIMRGDYSVPDSDSHWTYSQFNESFCGCS